MNHYHNPLENHKLFFSACGKLNGEYTRICKNRWESGCKKAYLGTRN